jgi:hypothetical protein
MGHTIGEEEKTGLADGGEEAHAEHAWAYILTEDNANTD